jgi:hypothetical protein
MCTFLGPKKGKDNVQTAFGASEGGKGHLAGEGSIPQTHRPSEESLVLRKLLRSMPQTQRPSRCFGKTSVRPPLTSFGT